MQSDVSRFETIELTEEIPGIAGVCFDPDNITLQGCYPDELSAYRAKRLWIETLENCFLLEQGHDFSVCVRQHRDSSRFVLLCEFTTACARYAFWRLTNHQAPEAQYVIETAHIPICDSRHEDIMRAPDLKSIHDGPLVLGGPGRSHRKGALAAFLKDIISRFKD